MTPPSIVTLGALVFAAGSAGLGYMAHVCVPTASDPHPGFFAGFGCFICFCISAVLFVIAGCMGMDSASREVMLKQMKGK